MYPIESSPLAFLTALAPAERAERMRAEAIASLTAELTRLLNSGDGQAGVWATFLRILFRPAESDADTIDFYERVLKPANLAKWISRDATMNLLAVIRTQEPFGLYLRAYKSESASETAEERFGQLRIRKSIEAGIAAQVFEALPIFGLCNVLDMNPLPKYQSVWLPPQFRHDWLTIVGELARLAELVVINASVPGTGLSAELDVVTGQFPDKTWLIVGRGEDGSIQHNAANAAERLLGYPDHVSEAQVRDNVVHDIGGLPPSWVRDLLSRIRSSKDRSVN